MKRNATPAILCFLLLTAFGCQQQVSTALSSSTVSVGPFSVDSESGLADGQAFGVDFKAMGASSVSVKFNLSGNPAQSSVSTIKLADDLSIELQTISDGDLVDFRLNGTKICDLEKGDKVVIDEERNVTVNGDAPKQ